MMESGPKKVFISYKREERELALFVRSRLAELGVEFFMDLELTPDGDYGSILDKYLAEAAAARIADELEVFERAEFEKALRAAQGRIARREREIEKRLKNARDAFENSIQDLRAGRDFMPPDPVNLLNDNVAKLREQMEINDGALTDLRSELEQSQRMLRDKDGDGSQRRSKLWAAT